MSTTINFADIVIHQAPDVREWKETAQITSVVMTPDDFVLIHTKEGGPDSWPDVTPPGWAGPIQWTLWAVVKGADGQWHTTGCIELWYGRWSTGGPLSKAKQDWFYFVPEMSQPQIGDEVGFFATAGDQRRKDVHAVTERSNIVVVPYQLLATYKFPYKSPEMPVAPEPIVPTPPVVEPPVPQPPSISKADLDAGIAQILARIDQLEADTKTSLKTYEPLLLRIAFMFGLKKA